MLKSVTTIGASLYTVVPVAEMILAKLLLNRLNEHFDQAGLLPESQCDVGKDRETIDIILATPREMSRTNCGPLHDLCRSHQSI